MLIVGNFSDSNIYADFCLIDPVINNLCNLYNIKLEGSKFSFW